MKKSEREAELFRIVEAFWKLPWSDIDDPQHALVSTLVDAEQAAGRRFDPEEEPLPERLEMVGRTAFYAGASPYFDLNMHLANAILLTDDIPATQRNERVLREAVRRYNAWPELRALADCLGDDSDPAYMLTREDRARRSKLLAILDGKEAPRG